MRQGQINNHNQQLTSTFHIITFWSNDPVARYRPSGLNETLYTGSVWPVSSFEHIPLSTSHSRTVESKLALQVEKHTYQLNYGHCFFLYHSTWPNKAGNWGSLYWNRSCSIGSYKSPWYDQQNSVRSYPHSYSTTSVICRLNRKRASGQWGPILWH